MHCPYCGEPDSRVIDTRVVENGYSVRRRRECQSCHRRFTTYERCEREPLVVIKKSGNRQLFDRKKILNGLLKACEKRPVSTETLEAVASEVEKELQEEGFEEVPSSYIGEKVMDKLEKIDQVAYVRFASVYREFRDVDQFIEILGSLVKEEKRGFKNGGNS